MACERLFITVDMEKLSAVKKAFLALLVVLASQAAFGTTPIDLGFNAGSTPYDRYMNPVKRVLTHLDGESPSLDRVRELMHEGRSFRYSFTEPYLAASPEVTAATRSGDCKAKAIWLANQLNDPNVRFVIGKARVNSRISHAWLMWQHDSQWWILDCTNMREPVPADRVSSREYIPLYSYAKNGMYRHQAAQMQVADRVATRGSTAVASSWQ